MSDEPYTDAFLYDLEFDGFDEDVVYYVELAKVLAAERPVIELGCGTGRLALPLARAGLPTVGIDRAGAMVDRLDVKLEQEPGEVRARLEVVRGDYRTWSPPKPASVVLWPFNALHHLDGPAALTAMLARIRSWTCPRGVLALDAYLPDPELYGTDPDRRYEPREFVDPHSGERIESWEQGWWDAEAETTHIVQAYRRPDGSERRVHLVLRMFTHDQLLTSIRDAGWQLVAEYGDFTGTALTPDSLKWVAQLINPG
ncbi:MAG: class I SAM-dependent methyltransferase [Myxococcota bacterium]